MALKVTQVKSAIGTKPKHRGTLRALGLGRIGKTNVLPDRPEIRGMIARVPHLIEVKDKSKQLALVLESTGLGERDVPDYIEVDHSKMTAKLSRIPQITEVPYPVQMEPHLVVEYYSR